MSDRLGLFSSVALRPFSFGLLVVALALVQEETTGDCLLYIATTMRTLLQFRIGLVILCLITCFRFGGAGSGSSSEGDEMSHYLYDEDADPVQDYHGLYVWYKLLY